MFHSLTKQRNLIGAKKLIVLLKRETLQTHPRHETPRHY